MDLHRIIGELEAELQRVNQAIEALERLSAGNFGRRVRTSRWLKEEIERHTPGSEIVAKDEPLKKNA
jgi:hypothetical protein